MPGEVESDDAMPFREVRELMVPNVTVTRPAVDENQSRFALALDAIVDGNSIGRGDVSVHFFVPGAE